jgi:hypothetical protein
MLEAVGLRWPPITLRAAPERPLLRAIEKLLGTRLRVYEVRSAA